MFRSKKKKKKDIEVIKQQWKKVEKCYKNLIDILEKDEGER